jgi:hypothetical protein
MFVERSSTRKGIATQLFLQCTEGFDKITVNSSDIAVPYYKKISFNITDTRSLKNGVWSTPMKWQRNAQQTHAPDAQKRAGDA